MARKNDSLLDDLAELPWWISVVLGVVVFAALKWVVPWYFAADESASPASEPAAGDILGAAFGGLASMAPALAPLAIVFALPAALSAIRQWGRRKDGRLPDAQGGGGLARTRLLDWKQFEALVGEHYRRLGHRVRTNPGDGPDGGVDLWVTTDQGLYLVQCKHWRRDVGVNVVRELYGVMAAEGAYGGAVVTSGSFSADARAFANGKPVDLVDGPALEAMITDVQRARG